MAENRKAPFRFWSFFFSLKGRVSRWPIIAIVIPSHLAFYGLSYVRSAALNAYMRSHPNDFESVATYLAIYAFVIATISLILLWPMFALPFKRLHDANMSGQPILIYWIPFIAGAGGSILLVIAGAKGHGPFPAYMHNAYFVWGARIISWAVAIVPALLPGTKGPNRYGPPQGQLPNLAEDVF